MAILTSHEREAYEIKARAILYPDLRARYIEDALMVDILATALAQVDHLARRGADTEQTMPAGRRPSAGNAKIFYELPSKQFEPKP